MDIDALIGRIKATPAKGRRKLIALAGPPASGKSTLAEALAARTGGTVVPMDGFHLDDRILLARGHRDRKGAPHTFDAAGFLNLVSRLAVEAEVIAPVFDRARELSIAGALVVGPGCHTVIVAGNYLLHDVPVWRDLARYWDLSIRLDVAEATLRTRLEKRWLSHGFSAERTRAWIEGNDIPNIRETLASSLPSDIVVEVP